MSSNCINKELKGGVNINRLPKVGEIHIHLNNSLNEIFRVYYRTTYSLLGDIKARIEGDAHFTNADGTQDLGKTFTGSAGSTADMRVSPGECDLFINHKYECTGLSVQAAYARCEIDISDLMYSVNPVSIMLINTKAFGDVSNYAVDCEALQLKNCNNIQGSIDNLIKASSFVGSTFSQLTGKVDISGAGVSIDLSSLAGKSAIKDFSPGATASGDIKYHGDINDSNIREIPNASITGTIEELVARAQAAKDLEGNYKTTGTITFSYNAKNFVNVTFEGVSLAENANVPNKEGAKFTWDAQGNITWS